MSHWDLAQLAAVLVPLVVLIFQTGRLSARVDELESATRDLREEVRRLTWRQMESPS